MKHRVPNPVHLEGTPAGASERRMRASRAVSVDEGDLAPHDERYRALVEHLDEGVLIYCESAGRFLEVNRSARELLGYSQEETLDTTFAALFPEPYRDVAAQVLLELSVAPSVSRSRVQFQRSDGSCFFGNLRVVASREAEKGFFLMTIRDISQEIRREHDLATLSASLEEARAQVAHSKRLATIGELAAGVAHEVSNPAAFISVYLNEVRREFARMAECLGLASKPGENREQAGPLVDIERGGRSFQEIDEMLADSLDGIQRIASMVSELRAFSRMERQDAEVLDVNEVVRTACKACHQQIRERARLEQELAAKRSIIGSRTRLIQVVTNLLGNASQAIQQGGADANCIRVATCDTEDGVMLTVEDTGVGMDAATQNRIFQPFFTTKDRQSGTGLGLALCMSIVREHKGQIRVRSQPGGPTVFEVWLPADTGMVPSWARIIEAKAPASATRKRILIVDDEIPLLKAYSRSLGRSHDVETAEGAEQGLARLFSGATFDLVVCDLVMPEMDGIAFYRRLEHKAPHLLRRVVFSSGGVFTPRYQDFLQSVKTPHLQKPLNLSAIEHILSQLT